MEAPKVIEPPAPRPRGASVAAPSQKDMDDTVAKLTHFLSSKNKESSRPSDIRSLMLDSVSNAAVVLVLPSLEARLEDKDGANPLPQVGEHRPENGGTKLESPDMLPEMEASVISKTSEPNVAENLKDQEAAKKMAEKTSWTKSTIGFASAAVSSTLSESFSSLVSSRVRAWTLLLLRHSLSTGDQESRTRLLGMLSTVIQVESMETNFQPLAMPDSAAGQRKEADVILPLLFEATLHLMIQENPQTLVIRAPGTVSADLGKDGLHMKKIRRAEIRLDTNTLLSSMVDQARIAVFKAVAKATKTPLPNSLEAPSVPSEGTKQKAEVPLVSRKSLAGFRSALNLSSAPIRVESPSPTLQKARSSALRLNGVLNGKGTQSASPSLGIRKLRSVNWDKGIRSNESPSPSPVPTSKKQRMALNASKLKSFKSFGRPHGGDFGSGPRNATFGEFGGRQALWGRDGRLAQHPMAMNSAAMQSETMATTGAADKNASFDIPVAEKASQMSFGLQGKGGGLLGRSNPGLKRSATVLENWLLKKSTSNGTKTFG